MDMISNALIKNCTFAHTIMIGIEIKIPKIPLFRAKISRSAFNKIIFLKFIIGIDLSFENKQKKVVLF